MAGAPIACNLNAEQLVSRVDEAGALAQRYLLSFEPTGEGARFVFAGDARADLDALIEAESKCCSFLRFELVRQGATLELTVEGPPEARPLIFGLFGVTEPSGAPRVSARVEQRRPRPRREWLLAPLAGTLIVLCCVGAPMLAGAIGVTVLGTVLGGVEVVLAALAVCLLAPRLVRGVRSPR